MHRRDVFDWMALDAQVTQAAAMRELVASQRQRAQAEVEERSAQGRAREAALFDKIHCAFLRFTEDARIDLRLDYGLADSDYLLGLPWEVKLSNAFEMLEEFRAMRAQFADWKSTVEDCFSRMSSLQTRKLDRKTKRRYESVISRMVELIDKSASAVACLEAETFLVDDDIRQRLETVKREVADFLRISGTTERNIARSRATYLAAELDEVLRLIEKYHGSLETLGVSRRSKELYRDLSVLLRSLMAARLAMDRSRFGVHSPFSVWAIAFAIAGSLTLGVFAPLAIGSGFVGICSRRRRLMWLSILGAVGGAVELAAFGVCAPWHWLHFHLFT
jgi:hypothetical protein